MSRERQTPSLGTPPDDKVTLRFFPSRPLHLQALLFRVVRKGKNPWWFGNSMAGRFDLPAPHGTCYLSTDPLAALLEVLGADLERWSISRKFIEERRLRELPVPRELSIADLTSREASGFGITAEIGTLVPYALPQAWAAKLHEVRFDGLVYWLRHDPSRAEGWAFFGREGERKSYRRGRELPIPSQLIDRLWRECRIAVARTPMSGDLTILDDV